MAMFGTDAFKYQYYDEEGDLITIKTDGELTDAYEIVEMMEQSSLKITLNETGEASVIYQPEPPLIQDISGIESADSFDLNDISREASDIPSVISQDVEEVKIEVPSPPVEVSKTEAKPQEAPQSDKEPVPEDENQEEDSTKKAKKDKKKKEQGSEEEKEPKKDKKKKKDEDDEDKPKKDKKKKEEESEEEKSPKKDKKKKKDEDDEDKPKKD